MSAPFGQTLFLWRQSQGLTQEALALAAGIPRPNLSGIEQGKREPSLITLRALAAALGIRPGILADGIGPPFARPGTSFSRQALERVADGIVFGAPLRNPEEQKLAKLVGPMVRSRSLAAGHRVKPAQGKRALQTAWLVLTSSYPPQVTRSLLQRIADRERVL